MSFSLALSISVPINFSLRKAQPTKLWANSSHYYFTCDLSVGSRLVGLPSLLFINLIHNVHHVACSATLAKIISVTAIGIGYSLIRITVRCYGDSAIFFLCISFSLAFGPRLFIFFIFFWDKSLRVRLIHIFKIENCYLKIFIEIRVGKKVYENA